jgi:hypothetical protein
VEISGDTAAQLVLAPVKRSLDQQDIKGQQALALIASASPQMQTVQSPAPMDGSKGGFVDTFA